MFRSLVFALACAASMQGGSLLFRAALSSTATADYAAGGREPLVRDRVRFSSAAVFPPTARLTYDARANMYAEQGTASFWWRPDQAPGRLGFPLFNVSYEQHGTWDFTFARIDWTGADLSARMRDRNLEFHTLRTPFKPEVGRWTHIALTWSETGGLGALRGWQAGSGSPRPAAARCLARPVRLSHAGCNAAPYRGWREPRLHSRRPHLRRAARARWGGRAGRRPRARRAGARQA